MRLLRLVFALAAFAALGTVSAPMASAGAAAGADRALQREASRLLRTPNGPPGIAITVQRGKRRTFLNGGRAIAGTRRRIRSTDHMRIASTAKAFSGAVALRLVERGQLKLSDTIGQRVPSLPKAWQNVTLRQLLNHTSGLPDYIESPETIARLQSDPRGYIPPEDILDGAAKEPLRFPSGSRYQYSNSDNIVVGLMAQSATARSYKRLLGRLVFGPLRLRRTSLPSGFLLPGPYIHGYDIVPGEAPQDVSTFLSMSGPWASGGITSTPGELHQFMRAYAGTKLLGRRIRRQQRRFVRNASSEPLGPGRNDAGLALFRYRMKCGTVYGHTGNLPGYTQFAAASRGGTRSVAVSVNIQTNPKAGDPAVFAQLRKVYGLASCAALARG